MQSPIDSEVFAWLADLQDPDDAGFVDEMLDMFEDDAPQIISRMNLALNEDEASGVQAPAHKLKSTAGLIGAMQLSGIDDEIETSARQGQLTGIAPMLLAQQAEYLRVCDHFADNAGRTAVAA